VVNILDNSMFSNRNHLCNYSFLGLELRQAKTKKRVYPLHTG